MTARTRRAATPTRRTSRSEAAEQAWMLLQEFADAHSRHGDLADALGFRLGAGRGKVLFGLRSGPLTLREIAASNRVDPPYATLIVDKLESHGLVERQPHPDDRRRKLVTLTAAGRAAIATAEEIRRRPPRGMSDLPTADLRQLTGLLQRLLAADEPPAADPQSVLTNP